MPDSVVLAWRRHHELAGAKLGQYLLSLPGSPRELTTAELQTYRARRVIVGWRLNVAFPDCMRRLDLLIDSQFPHMPPRVALVDRPPLLTWPHVEDDGVLCLLPGSAEISYTAPVEVVQSLLGSAVELVEQCAAGLNQEDFQTEFLSYWGRVIDTQAVEFRSLVTPVPPSRAVWVWRGRSFYLFSDDEPAALSWLRNLFQEVKERLWTTEPAALLWLDRPLYPQEYPRTAADVWALARERSTEGGVTVLESLATGVPERIAVLLGAPTPHGPCLAGVSIPAPKAAHLPTGQSTNPLLRGFRPGKVPPDLLARRYFGVTSVVRSAVSRVDPAWVHGRGQDLRQPHLRTAKVAIIGCGSVGGPIALKLAQVGVGYSILIDPEKLTWANVGRQPLGAGQVGEFKAAGIATRIKADYPHVSSVEAHCCRWEDLALQEPALLASCDLIVSAVGNWNAEGALNEWHLANGRRPTIVYGWTEPHACAGHAVAITSEGGCLQCGFTDCGEPSIRVTDWPEGRRQVQEPTCGAVYQPYGPIELTHIEALIGELTLDCILRTVSTSQHRIWAARRSVLEAAGGTWNQTWIEMMPGCQQGGFLYERPWPSMLGCRACQLAIRS